MVKLFLSKILAGFMVGAGAIIPGLSGGILAVSMGLYQPMIEAIAGFFKNVKKNFKFLLPLAVGGILGFVVFMFLIDSLFADYQTEIVCLFMGLVIGGIPAFFREAKGGEPFRKTSWLYLAASFVLAFAIVVWSSLTESGEVAGVTGRKLTPFISAICGGVIVLGTVLPGISTSFVLINMGVYESFMKVFTNLLVNPGQNIVLALCAVLGIIIVAIPMLLVVRKLLKKFHRQSYFALFGILLATLAGCIMQEIKANISGVSFIEAVIFIILFAGGVAASYFMDNAMKKLKVHEQQEPELPASDA